VLRVIETPRLWEGERIDPDELVERAKREHPPVAAFCLFSGGNDSAVLAHRMRGQYDALVFIDTGTALPGVRDHAQRVADWLGEELIIYDAGDAFEQIVLHKPGIGFPGPAQHRIAYARLKDRSVEALVRAHKRERMDRVLLLTGVRRAESQRRMGDRKPLARRFAQVWANPLTDWTNAETAAYRREHGLPESDVAALIHRSGECNCGCFAAPGEREMLADLFPEWWARIEDLERRAEAAGKRYCRWGGRPGPATDAGPLCSDCELRLEMPGEAA
jgi:3'-phosphoadenosine 5'-phosphosulfate sulfotransferase (PAPS reductase)/FAD synthetase